MKTTVVKYGLQHVETGEMIGVDAAVSASLDGSDGDGLEYQLDCQGEQEWLVDSPEHAEWVRLNDTEYYNAGYDTPQHMGLLPEQMRVVRVEKVVEVTPIDVKIPTKLEFDRKTYGKGGKYEDLRHLAILEANIDDYNPLYWDYVQHYRDVEKRSI